MWEVASSSLLVGTHSRSNIIFSCIIVFIYTNEVSPKNWRSNHRDRSMFPSFQSTPWVYTALQVWAPAAFSSEFPFSDSSTLLSPNSSLLLVAQYITFDSIQALYSHTHIPTISYYNTTPYHALSCRPGAGSKPKSRIKWLRVGRFPLWSLEHFSPVNPINSIRSTSQQRDTENTLNLQLDYIHFCHFKRWNLRKVECNATSGYIFIERLSEITWYVVFLKVCCLRKRL